MKVKIDSRYDTIRYESQLHMQDWILLIHETIQTNKTQDRLNVKYLSLMSDFPHFMIRFLYICTLIEYICKLCVARYKVQIYSILSIALKSWTG
jgi:hypothetical protein